MNQIRLLGAKTITFRQRIQGNKNALNLKGECKG